VTFTPWKNPLAVYAYRCSLVGLTPGLGAVLGPVAVGMGWVALNRFRRDPAISARVTRSRRWPVGALEFLTNAAGLALHRRLGCAADRSEPMTPADLRRDYGSPA